MGDTRRIHFMTDVHGDPDGQMACELCGFTGTKEEIYENRRGLVSECDKERLRQWLFGGGD